jgi:hypothetical protein
MTDQLMFRRRWHLSPRADHPMAAPGGTVRAGDQGRAMPGDAADVRAWAEAHARTQRASSGTQSRSYPLPRQGEAHAARSRPRCSTATTLFCGRSRKTPAAPRRVDHPGADGPAAPGGRRLVRVPALVKRKTKRPTVLRGRATSRHGSETHRRLDHAGRDCALVGGLVSGGISLDRQPLPATLRSILS